MRNQSRTDMLTYAKYRFLYFRWVFPSWGNDVSFVSVNVFSAFRMSTSNLIPVICHEEHGVGKILHDAIARSGSDHSVRLGGVGCLRCSADIGFT